MSTVFNFNAGPAALPHPVLEKVQAELLDYQGKGMSIMEMSHRSKEFEAINTRAEANFKRLIGVGDGYRVLFVQGGASTQFATVPMNFLPAGGTADYLVTGELGREGHRGSRPLRQGEPRRLDQGRRLQAGAHPRRGQAQPEPGLRPPDLE